MLPKDSQCPVRFMKQIMQGKRLVRIHNVSFSCVSSPTLVQWNFPSNI